MVHYTQHTRLADWDTYSRVYRESGSLPCLLCSHSCHWQAAGTQHNTRLVSVSCRDTAGACTVSVLSPSAFSLQCHWVTSRGAERDICDVTRDQHSTTSGHLGLECVKRSEVISTQFLVHAAFRKSFLIKLTTNALLIQVECPVQWTVTMETSW